MADATPTLHEIALMPFPASRDAMRKHYVEDWGKPVPEGAQRRQEFDVEIDYEVRRGASQTLRVEAFSADEAEEIASDQVATDERDADDLEIISATAREVRQ